MGFKAVFICIGVSFFFMSCADRVKLSGAPTQQDDAITPASDLNKLPGNSPDQDKCGSRELSVKRSRFSISLTQQVQRKAQYDCAGNPISESLVQMKVPRQQISIPDLNSDYKFYQPELKLMNTTTCQSITVKGEDAANGQFWVNALPAKTDLLVASGENLIQYEISVCTNEQPLGCAERSIADGGSVIVKVNFKKTELPRDSVQNCDSPSF